MNWFQVEQVTGRPHKSGRFSRMFTSIAVTCAALLVGSLTSLSGGSTVASFAQNLPKPQQVLGETDETNRCEGLAYKKPLAVALSSKAPGLHYREDDPQFYGLYGSNVDQLRSAITNCEVRKQSGDYHALTTYTLNWQYDTQVNAGQCTLQNIKIGLATNQYFPRLADNQALSAEDQATWNAYYASLVSHENEHLALNKKYAADLHTALTNLSLPCSSIESYAKTLVSTHVQLLNYANTLLDSKTNHGADNGAVL